MDIAELRRGDFFPTFLPGKAMIHSSRRERKTKAIVEVLAMLADAHPKLMRHRPRPVRETDKIVSPPARSYAEDAPRAAGPRRLMTLDGAAWQVPAGASPPHEPF
jgi:hypothetical protein